MLLVSCVKCAIGCPAYVQPMVATLFSINGKETTDAPRAMITCVIPILYTHANHFTLRLNDRI